MAGGAEAAKNALESVFNKTKEALSSAGTNRSNCRPNEGSLAESTKGLANVAFENVQKIIPGQANANNADPAAVTVPTANTAATGAGATDPAYPAAQ
ncbi:hypothetical protein AAVH_01490 [Aphelenchoides avenae]|nr:hypothetical protein AAVH_01490 [Aphelenchus avenae]